MKKKDLKKTNFNEYVLNIAHINPEGMSKIYETNDYVYKGGGKLTCGSYGLAENGKDKSHLGVLSISVLKDKTRIGKNVQDSMLDTNKPSSFVIFDSVESVNSVIDCLTYIKNFLSDSNKEKEKIHYIENGDYPENYERLMRGVFEKNSTKNVLVHFNDFKMPNDLNFKIEHRTKTDNGDFIWDSNSSNIDYWKEL
jgi:hypothetical protein